MQPMSYCVPENWNIKKKLSGFQGMDLLFLENNISNLFR